MQDKNDKHNISGNVFADSRSVQTEILGTLGDVDETFQRVMPRSGFYVKAEDTLLLNITSIPLTAQIFLNYRLLLPDGTIITAQENLTFTSVGNEIAKTIALVEGWLLSVTVELNTAQIPTGACYVQVFLIRGSFLNVVWPTQLIGDYLNSFYHLGWPGAPILKPTEGRGHPLTLVGGAVGAGLAIQLNLSNQFRFVIDSVDVVLVTSAAAANRFVRINLFDGTRTYIQASSGFAQAASLTTVYSFAAGEAFNSTATDVVNAPLPLNAEGAVDQPLNITATALNLQAADQFSNLFVRARAWHESD